MKTYRRSESSGIGRPPGRVARQPRAATGSAGVIGAALLVVSWLSTAWAMQGAVTATTPKRGGNATAAKLTNPVAAGPEAIAAGQRTYRMLCARCHGPEGKGDGGGAGAGGQPSDFTDDEWEFGGSDGEIFAVIQQGTSADMEAYGERLSDIDIWNLVHYLRTLNR